MNAATTAGLHIIVEQRDAAWRDAVPRAEAICRRAAMESLREANADLPDGEVSIVLGDDALLRELNRDWRSIDAPTNVLAFPCDGPGPTETGPVLLGDVVISYQTAAMEAARDGKTIADHLVHLVVHGILHLLAYDHQTDVEARVMEVLETRILGTLHIADPYKDEPAGPE